MFVGIAGPVGVFFIKPSFFRIALLHGIVVFIMVDQAIVKIFVATTDETFSQKLVPSLESSLLGLSLAKIRVSREIFDRPQCLSSITW